MAKKRIAGAATAPAVLKIDPKDVKCFNLDPFVIDRSPWQPRQEFPKEEIQALGESILAQGQLTPILVRPGLAGQFELIDGERRFRACQAVGVKTIRAECINATDAEVRAMVLAAALQRKDLNAIEEARAFQAAIAAGDAAGPTELAKQLGVSQGHVSNRLRLLELPADWQTKVISREIPASHARSVARYKDVPVVLDAIGKELVAAMEGETSLGSAEEWDTQIDRIAWEATGALNGLRYSEKLRQTVSVFKPTPEQREQLAVIEIQHPWRGHKAEERATNIELWEKLQAEHEARLAAKADKKTEKVTKPTKDKPLSPSQQKRLAKEEVAKDKERARRLSIGVWSVAIEWRRYLIAKACRESQVGPEDVLRLAVYFATEHRTCERGGTIRERGLGLGEVLRINGVAVKKRRDSFSLAVEVYNALAATPDKDLAETLLKFFAELFWDETDGPKSCIPDGDVLAIAEKLGIDLTAAWKAEAAGPLTERWANLRNKSALTDLLEAWGISPLTYGSKCELVGAVVTAARKQKVPAELLKPKEPKG